MFPLPAVFINITFKYLDPEHENRTGNFISSYTLDDIKNFLDVDDWENYRCIHGAKTISPFASFDSYANGQTTMTIHIVKKQPARTKLTNYIRPKSPEPEEDDSEEVITIYVD